MRWAIDSSPRCMTPDPRPHRGPTNNCIGNRPNYQSRGGGHGRPHHSHGYARGRPHPQRTCDLAPQDGMHATFASAWLKKTSARSFASKDNTKNKVFEHPHQL